MLSLLAVALAAGPAAARPLPDRAFLVVVPKANATTSAGVEAGLKAALEAEKVPLTDTSYLFPPVVPHSNTVNLIAEGKKAYDDLDLDAASQKFTAALAFATRKPGAVEPGQLAELHMLLAAVALQNAGKKGQKIASDELALALTLAPDLQLDTKFFAPDAKKLFDKVKAEALGKGTGKLTASSTPPSDAFVLGRAVGQGTEVIVGRHLVTFKRPGYLQAGVLLDVSTKGAEAKATLSPAPEYASVLEQAAALVPAAFGGTKLPPEAQSFGQRVQSRFLVLVSADASAGVLEVWDLESGNRLKDVAFDGDAGLRACAQRVKMFLDAPSPVVATKSEPKAERSTRTIAAVKADQTRGGAASVEQPGKVPVYQQKWFWPAVGGVVAAAAITTGVVLVASSAPSFNPVLSY